VAFKKHILYPSFGTIPRDVTHRIMAQYELMMILDPAAWEDTRNACIDGVKKALKNVKAKVENEDVWGEKKLAYKINSSEKGYYILWTIEVIIIGNVTRDPIVKETENGKKIAMFSTATNRYYTTADGENKSEAEFHNCVAWWALAERCEQFLTKGKLIYIEGRLKTRVIEKDSGERIYKTEVVAGNIIFLNKRGEMDEAADDTSDEGRSSVDVPSDDDMF